MPHVRIETSVRHHRKFLEIDPAACWLWACGLMYCQDTLTDGFIPASALDMLGVKGPSKAARLAAELVAGGLWEPTDGGWRVHDYLEFNKTAEEVKELRAVKQKAGAAGGRASRGGQAQSKQRAEAEPKSVLNPLCTGVVPAFVAVADIELKDVAICSNDDCFEKEPRLRVIFDVVHAVSIERRVDAGEFHRDVEMGLRRKGLQVIREFSVPGVDVGTIGRIDLVVEGEPAIAIELDNRLGKARSVQKLLAFSGLRVIVMRDGYDKEPIAIQGIDLTISCAPLPPSLSGRVDRSDDNGSVDGWFEELASAYPPSAVTRNYKAMHAFSVIVAPGGRRVFRGVFDKMLANLASQKTGAQWSKGMIPHLDRWLSDGLWQQEHKPAAAVQANSRDPQWVLDARARRDANHAG